MKHKLLTFCLLLATTLGMTAKADWCPEPTGDYVNDYSKMLSEYISEHVKFIAPVYVYPGEGELSALAAGAVRVLSGEEEPKEYVIK